MEALTDNSLMLKVKGGDLSKMALLFERHHRRLFSFFFRLSGLKQESEDMVQTVFYRMLKYVHTFRGEGEFKTWMFHLARNVSADFYKKQPPPQKDVSRYENRIADSHHADDAHQKSEDKQMLHAAMQQLSPDKREVLILSKFEEMKYADIAKIQDCSEEAVKVRVHRAMKELKENYLLMVNV